MVVLCIRNYVIVTRIDEGDNKINCIKLCPAL
jgi:hypothetical protein